MTGLRTYTKQQNNQQQNQVNNNNQVNNRVYISDQKEGR